MEAVIDITESCTLAPELAQRMRIARDELTKRWLDRIAARVAVDAEQVFPSDELLDHVPLLVDRIADYLADPADEITADGPLIAKAMELGELRFTQGFDVHEILKEHELLGGVLFNFIAEEVEQIEQPCTRAELLVCAHRLFRAVSVIEQITTTHFLRVAGEQIHEREERLRRFNRMVSHELKNRIGVIAGAGEMLHEERMADRPDQREKFAAMVVENAREIQSLLDNLLELSRIDEGRQHRNVLLPKAAAEAARQLREMARARGVEVRVAQDLPPIEVNAAVIELCLSNYISNAIKYADPDARNRWVDVQGGLRFPPRGGPRQQAPCELFVRVVDNGLGVPEPLRDHLFRRFFRAHEETVSAVEGTGLGLSIVRETIESMGGRVWAEFPEKGSVFAFALPCRRDADVSAAERVEVDKPPAVQP